EAQQRRLAEKRLYVSDMNLAQQAWDASNLERAADLLDRHQLRAGQEDLRGFEWFYLWRLCRGNAVATLYGHTAAVHDVAFSPDGKILASGSGDRTVRLWSMPSGRELMTLHGHRDQVHAVAFSPDGKTLVSGSDDRTIKLWEARTWREKLTLNGHRA